MASENPGKKYQALGLDAEKEDKCNIAATYYKMAINAQPDNIEYLDNLIQVLKKTGYFVEASQTLYEAAKLRLTSGKNFDIFDAIARLKKAIRLRPDNIRALNRLGSAYQKLGRHDEALIYYVLSYKLKPRPEVNTRITEILTQHESGVYTQALFLTKLIGHPPAQLSDTSKCYKDHQAIQILALALKEIGQERKIAGFTTHLTIDPNLPVIGGSDFATTTILPMLDAKRAKDSTASRDRKLNARRTAGISTSTQAYIK